MSDTIYDMKIFPTVDSMKAARDELGQPGALNEGLVATGIDALFLLLDGKVVEIDGTRWRLEEVKP